MHASEALLQQCSPTSLTTRVTEEINLEAAYRTSKLEINDSNLFKIV